MQVLKHSEVKFVSGFGFSLFPCFWISLWSSQSSRSFCLMLRKKKSLADFKPAKRILLFSWTLQAGGSGHHFLIFYPFLVFLPDCGLVWATVFTGAQFQANALRVLCGSHCPLHICTRPAPLIYLIAQPFDQSLSAVSGSKSHPSSSLFVCLGLPMPKIPSGHLSCPIELSLSGHCYLSESLVFPFD